MTPAFTYLVFSGLLCAFAGLVISDRLGSRKAVKQEWHELVARLSPLNVVELSTVAVDYMTPHPNQIEMDPGEIWEFIGGYEGLKKMRANAEIMLALAVCAQQWNFAEAVIVTERMRHDAVSLRRAIRRVELGFIPLSLLRRFRYSLPLNAQEASSAYYLMRLRLLSLYETSHAGRYSALAAAI
jgi:hypothetical protein